MAQVFLTPKAKEDLYGMWYYIAVEKNNPFNADKFIDRIDQTMKSLAQNLKIGSKKPEYGEGMFQFSFDKYLFFYVALESGIEAIRVIHSNRDLPQLFPEF